MRDFRSQKSFMNGKILCIAGATGVGKSKIAIEMAKAIGGEIISADSMQIYKGLDIGTAKITQEETNGIKHYMLDILSPDDKFSGFEFAETASDIIKQLFSKNVYPIVVGGTGFYFDSLLYPPTYTDTNKDSIRAKLLAQAEEYGADYVYDLLKSVDKESAEKIHKNNIVRVVRALEIYYSTGKKKSELPLPINKKFDADIIVLTTDRNTLYDRIDDRVDKMVNDGLFDEVKDLYQKFGRDCLCFSAIGYKEILDYFDGKTTKEESVAAIKLNSRHYAKRQISYFKRFKDAVWIDVDYDFPQRTVDKILEAIDL